MKPYAPTRPRNQGRKNPCCHCFKRKVSRPRGLCWTCYYTPGVKELHPSTSKYARRGVGNTMRGSLLPPEPTNALPGSPEKIAVMAQRAEMGCCLFHPADARYPGDPLPDEFRRLHRQ